MYSSEICDITWERMLAIIIDNDDGYSSHDDDDDDDDDGGDNDADDNHPTHVLQSQGDRVVPILVFAVLVCLPTERESIVINVINVIINIITIIINTILIINHDHNHHHQHHNNHNHHHHLSIHLLSKSSINPLS